MKKLFGILIAVALLLSVLAAVAEEGPSIANAQVGDTVTFGRYEQDNKMGNGPEDIEWTVLGERDGAKLLLAREGLMPMAFSKEDSEATWSTSTVRGWLNNGFYAVAFNADERGRILLSHLENADNPEFGTDGGEDTDDRVFLLSIDELNEYLPVQEERVAEPTAFAKAKGAFVSDINQRIIWWMLRSPGKDLSHSAIVNSWGFSGGVYPNLEVPYEGEQINVADDCVRPAIWVAPEGAAVEAPAPDGSMAPWEALDALGDELYRNTYSALVMGEEIKKGSKGETAKGVQQTLVALGQDIAVDGSVGAKTIGALNEVQAALGLEKTEYVDESVYAELLPNLLQAVNAGEADAPGA